MRRLCLTLSSLLLLASCSTVSYVPVTVDTPSLPLVTGEYAIENLVEEPETVYDILQNSVIYEHQYYVWHSYALILHDYMVDMGELFKVE